MQHFFKPLKTPQAMINFTLTSLQMSFAIWQNLRLEKKSEQKSAPAESPSKHRRLAL